MNVNDLSSVQDMKNGKFKEGYVSTSVCVWVCVSQP